MYSGGQVTCYYSIVADTIRIIVLLYYYYYIILIITRIIIAIIIIAIIIIILLLLLLLNYIIIVAFAIINILILYCYYYNYITIIIIIIIIIVDIGSAVSTLFEYQTVRTEQTQILLHAAGHRGELCSSWLSSCPRNTIFFWKIFFVL